VTYTLESEARCQAERIPIYAVPTYNRAMDPLFLSLVPGIMRRGGSKPRGRERSAAQRSAGSETESSHSGPSGFPFLFVSQGARGKKAFHHRATPSRQPPGRVTLALYTRAHSSTYLTLPTYRACLTLSHTHSFLSRNNPCSLQVQQSWLQLSSLRRLILSCSPILFFDASSYLPSMPNKSRLISSPLFLLTTSVSPFSCI
jgi:hypothetical protein